MNILLDIFFTRPLTLKIIFKTWKRVRNRILFLLFFQLLDVALYSFVCVGLLFAAWTIAR